MGLIRIPSCWSGWIWVWDKCSHITHEIFTTALLEAVCYSISLYRTTGATCLPPGGVEEVVEGGPGGKGVSGAFRFWS